MPLPMKSLREASAELGIPEVELKAMVQMGKVRAVMKKSAIFFAPDELAKMKRLRKTALDSAKPATATTPATPAPPPKPVTPPKPTFPRKPTTSRFGGQAPPKLPPQP